MEADKNALREAKLKQMKEEMVTSMTTDLDKLFENRNSFQKNGFLQLFTKYISQDGQESVEWEEIKKPPPDSVGNNRYLMRSNRSINFI